MYRLLIVTGDPKTQEMFEGMDGWETMGVKPPRLRTSVEAALECMGKHHIDAIAVEAAPEFEALLTYLDQQRPDMPIFRIEPTAEAQRSTIREACSLLTRLKADDSNDSYDDAQMLELQRERWLRRVIGGMVHTRDDLQRQRTLYRCRVSLDVPCVLARLELPCDDHFMSERWHYGSERLETALRNFFGREHDHMLLHVAVVSQQEVRVLCYPLDEQDGLSENAAYDYIQETIEQIAGYLGLSLKVLEVRRIPGLMAFAAENEAL